MKDILQNIALFIPLIPATVALIYHRVLGKAQRMLGLFLVIGFLTDLKKKVDALAYWGDFIFSAYVLLEVTFYTWFVAELSTSEIVKKSRDPALAVCALLWLIGASRILWLDPHPLHPLCDVGTALILSFLSAWSLLELTKIETPLSSQPEFWFVLGVFIYFVCSNFIFAFVRDDMREKIWFIHSTFDILKMILFSIGFVLCVRKSSSRIPK